MTHTCFGQLLVAGTGGFLGSAARYALLRSGPSGFSLACISGGNPCRELSRMPDHRVSGCPLRVAGAGSAAPDARESRDPDLRKRQRPCLGLPTPDISCHRYLSWISSSHRVNWMQTRSIFDTTSGNGRKRMMGKPEERKPRSRETARALTRWEPNDAFGIQYPARSTEQPPRGVPPHNPELNRRNAHSTQSHAAGHEPGGQPSPA